MYALHLWRITNPKDTKRFSHMVWIAELIVEILEHIRSVLNTAFTLSVFVPSWKDVTVTLITRRAPVGKSLNKRPVGLCHTRACGTMPHKMQALFQRHKLPHTSASRNSAACR